MGQVLIELVGLTIGYFRW